jgi:hypothetical protein
MQMKQGTISVICGIHSPTHSALVFLSWRKIYGKFPNVWQTGCIFLHDVGHWGKQYHDSVDEKNKHWILGANIARKLFGQKGFDMVAGHVGNNGYPQSQLYKADKYSWYITPYWLLYWNNIVEPKVKCGMKNHDAIISFQKWVKQSIESGEYRNTHEAYVERLKGVSK